MFLKSHLHKVTFVLLVTLITSACAPVFVPTQGRAATTSDFNQAQVVVQEMADEDVLVRANAIFRLSQLGAQASQYVPDLIAATQDPAAEVRVATAFALGEVGASAEQTIPILLALVTDPNEPVEVRYSAIRALGNLGSFGDTAISTLGTLVAEDPDDNIRWAAVDALCRMGKGSDSVAIRDLIPVLIDAQQDPSWSVANCAGELLAALGEESADLMIADLKMNTDWGRRGAILATLARTPEIGAPRLGAILAEPNPANELAVLSAAWLSQMGQPGFEQLASAADLNISRRHIAIAALPQFGEQAVNKLLEIAETASLPLVRNNAISALGTTGTAALPALEQLFRGATTLQQRQGIVKQGLVRVGAPAIPLLVELLESSASDTNTKKVILAALKDLAASPAATIPTLLSISQDGQVDSSVRVAALQTLAAYGTNAQGSIHVLQALATTATESDEIRSAAISALVYVGPGRAEVIDTLLEGLAHCNAVASSSAKALGILGILAQSAVPSLLEAMKCTANPAMHLETIASLSQVRPLSTQVLDTLADELADPGSDQAVVEAAAKSLAQMGPGAIPSLLTVLTSPLILTPARQQAADALASMGAMAAPGLVDLLENSQLSDETHALAQDALAKMKRQSLPFLVQALRNSDLSVRQRILDTLYKIGPHAFEGFQWAMQDPDIIVDDNKLNEIFGTFRVNHDATVIESGMAVPEALPFLISTMTLTGTIEERREAPVALGFIGPEAAPAVPVLALALSDSDPVFRCDAALALLLIGPNGGGTATTALAETLDGTQADVLCRVDSDSKRMIGIRKPIGYEFLLDEILASSNQDKVSLQHLLLYVLMSQGEEAAAAVPALVNALREPSTRRLAAEALGQAGGAAHPLLLEILQPTIAMQGALEQAKNLSRLNNDLRRSAAYALLRSTAVLQPAALDVLMQMAGDQTEDPHVRSMIVAALGAHGHPFSALHSGDDVLKQVAPTCPAWAEGMSGVHLIGYDLYLDRCSYTEGDPAPSWKKVFKWLVSTWKR